MKANSKKIKLIVEKTNTGFSAFSEEFPIFTTGRTIPELMENALEAANLYLEDEKVTLSQENLKFEIDFKQFFQYYRVLNSKFLAEKIGMNPTLLSQYVQGRKKPSETQTEKILSG
ncbi:MAG: type II toxin-antitoxin system HicB family antitoxin, partial [Bacteroidales bacterium]